MRDTERAFVVEGAKVLGEALDAGVAVESIYWSPADGAPSAVEAAAKVVDRAAAVGVRVFELAPGVLERVADTVTPQPVMAVVPYQNSGIDTLSSATMVVVCVDVRDPGNAGTVLRSAEAAGADGVVFCEGSVDVHNPKTVRSSAGTLFHVPVVAGGQPLEVLTQLAQFGLRRVGTSASAGDAYDEIDLRRPVALVVGNESRGLPTSVEPALDALVRIPMVGRAESLNVGMATAVLCFEAARQRRRGGS